MVPGLDLAGLRRRVATLNATAVPVRDKRARLVPVPVLIDAGIGLMAAAERGPSPTWSGPPTFGTG